MADIAAFILGAAAIVMGIRFHRGSERVYRVDADNKEVPSSDLEKASWHRATCTLIMFDPPEMFYEPKEWSHTIVILCKQHDKLALPHAVLNQDETCAHAAERALSKLGVDVRQPENCLHHLFTFPNKNLLRWSDFMECVYRGTLDQLYRRIPAQSIVRLSLGDLKDVVFNENDNLLLEDDSYYAMRLYFQRQGDLRARRRLLKGYSSTDLEHYKLRPQEKIVFYNDLDKSKHEAVDFTMETDDGMSPKKLFKADLVLLGVSRSGKTPISLILSQTMGLKVANIPLVVDMPPPEQLFKVNPKRVFCLTVSEQQLKLFRQSRLQRELQKKGLREKSTYANLSYIRRDLQHAQEICTKHGFTEINVSGRAIEETASLIASKLKERFPGSDVGTHA